MANFTTINSTADLTHVDVLNELVGGVRERMSVLGLPSGPIYPSLVVKGTDVQSATFWSTLQARIEAYYNQYVDVSQPVGSPGNYHGASAIPLYTSLAAFRAAAGLPSAGFRRAISWDTAVNDWTNNNDPMYSYGYMQADGQADDIIGPWIWVDLQRALSAMVWTLAQYSNTAMDYRGDRANMQADCAAAYSALSWYWFSASSFGGLYWAKAGIREYPAGYWQSMVNRRRCKPTAPVNTSLPVECDIYHYIEAPIPDGQYSGGQYVDVDSLGVNSGEWCYHETLPAVDPPVAARQSATWFGDYLANDPLPSLGSFCPGGAYKGAQASDCRYLCKWQFSHS